MEKILENECLRVVITPGFGGKITSLFHKESSFEAAAQPGEKEKMVSRRGFSRYAYGFDDAFPNIDAENFVWNGKEKRYPDHGEIWHADFTVLSQGRDFVRMVWESRVFSYRYEKEVRLFSNALVMRCHIANIGEDELPAIWTWHGLMRYEEDMEILLPFGTGRCRNVLSERMLGAPDTIYTYDNPVYDFRKVPAADSRRAVKYYLEPGEVGAGRGEGMHYAGGMPAAAHCGGETRFVGGDVPACRELLPAVGGFYYPSRRMFCMLHYDVKKLPYLGVWVTAGGFEGDYNCALEPSDGFYDSVRKAGENGRLPVLASGAAADFGFAVSLFSKEKM